MKYFNLFHQAKRISKIKNFPSQLIKRLNFLKIQISFFEIRNSVNLTKNQNKLVSNGQGANWFAEIFLVFFKFFELRSFEITDLFSIKMVH